MGVPALQANMQISAFLAEFTIAVKAIVLPADILTALLPLGSYSASWPLPRMRGTVAGGVVEALAFVTPILTAKCLVSEALGICAGVHFSPS